MLAKSKLKFGLRSQVAYSCIVLELKVHYFNSSKTIYRRNTANTAEIRHCRASSDYHQELETNS